MALSVRMDPLLEAELQQAAERQGLTKSQFVIAAVERALGRKNPFELMQSLQAEEKRAPYRVAKGAAVQAPYEPAKAKAALRRKLKQKHGAGSAR